MRNEPKYKFTKKERHKIYKKALIHYANTEYTGIIFGSPKYEQGICCLLYEIANPLHYAYNTYLWGKAFPELNLFNPCSDDIFWWNDVDCQKNIDDRIICLLFLIEMSR